MQPAGAQRSSAQAPVGDHQADAVLGQLEHRALRPVALGVGDGVARQPARELA